MFKCRSSSRYFLQLWQTLCLCQIAIDPDLWQFLLLFNIFVSKNSNWSLFILLTKAPTYTCRCGPSFAPLPCRRGTSLQSANTRGICTGSYDIHDLHFIAIPFGCQFQPKWIRKCSWTRWASVVELEGTTFWIESNSKSLDTSDAEKIPHLLWFVLQTYESCSPSQKTVPVPEAKRFAHEAIHHLRNEKWSFLWLGIWFFRLWIASYFHIVPLSLSNFKVGAPNPSALSIDRTWRNAAPFPIDVNPNIAWSCEEIPRNFHRFEQRVCKASLGCNLTLNLGNLLPGRTRFCVTRTSYKGTVRPRRPMLSACEVLHCAFSSGCSLQQPPMRQLRGGFELQISADLHATRVISQSFAPTHVIHVVIWNWYKLIASFADFAIIFYGW